MVPNLRPSDRREQILFEATRLFAESGFEGTSIRRIAGKCGISEAAIYRHFKSKIDLYEGAIRHKAAAHDITDFLSEQSGERGIEDVLTRMANHILSYLKTDPELLGLMFSNSVDSGPVAAVLFREVRLPYINYLAGELQRRIATGEVREVDPWITSRCFVGMVMDCALSVGVWNKIMKFEFRADDVVCNNVPIFARGLENPAAQQRLRH